MGYGSKGRSGRFTRFLRLAFTVYLWAAVVYTAIECVLLPTWHAFTQSSTSLGLQHWASHAYNDNRTLTNLKLASGSRSGEEQSRQELKDRVNHDKSSFKVTPDAQKAPNDARTAAEVMAWHAPTHALAHNAIDDPALPKSQLEKLFGADSNTGVEMSEDFFLNKAFGETLQPSKVVPYYYRASQQPAEEDITITTLITPNRFKVFADLVERYQGPISVTIHVTDDSTRTTLLKSLHQLYTTSPYMSTYVDVHLVIDTFERQFNMWRNVARFFARTDYLMMLDVDFWLCTDFRQRILNSPQIMDKLRDGHAAFVIPAFEFNVQEDGMDTSTFPTNKDELVQLVKENKIDMFHKSWQPGHGSTNYTRYYEANLGDVYKVQGYTHSYEPYAIFKKQGTPYCDERFIGYGGNKAACLYELYLSGVSYYVLPEDFLVHQSHAYAEKARQHERRYNRKLYTDFREELCFRYLNRFVDSGEVNTSKARNLLVECKKIKGFSTAAEQIIREQAPTVPQKAKPAQVVKPRDPQEDGGVR